VRTLVVSDLHLGAASGRARLDDDGAVEALGQAAAKSNRLVLLGDVIELRQRPMRDALAAASRVLPRLVAGMEPGSEVVLVAGNHDHGLLSAWIARRGANASPPAMTLETSVDWSAGEALAAVAEMLARFGAQVRAVYPGVWLREDVYATHGHYLDPHSTAPGFERLGAGVMSKLLKLAPGELRCVDEYERILAPIYAWMLAISERGGPELDAADGGGSSRVLRLLREGGLKGNAVQLGVSAAARLLQLAGLGELSGDVSRSALSRNELRALGAVLLNLGVDAKYVLFGHTHRAGPLPADNAARWVAPTGARLLNSGCWVEESAALMSPTEAPSSGYRAGFAIELEDQGPPRLVNLLES